MTRGERRKCIRELKEKGIELEYEVITDHNVSSSHYLHVIQPRILRDKNRRGSQGQGLSSKFEKVK